MKHRILALVLVLSLMLAGALSAQAAPGEPPAGKMVGINVVLNVPATAEILAGLGAYGRVVDAIPAINAVELQAKFGNLEAIRALPYVAAANPDAERKGSPVDTVALTDMMDGLSTWDLDAINVTDFGFANRKVAYDGSGVYVAVLDTGLLDSWRQYFPQERIAVEYAKCFGGGGGEMGFVSEQPNKWEHDQNSHGTHVTSTILGYSLSGTPVNGVAPLAKVIPVKVLNQNGSGWSSVVAAGITYVADLKAGPLAGSPVVVNMSLGGPELDAMEKAAIDYAISKGVIVVASAGNEGMAGMGYRAPTRRSSRWPPRAGSASGRRPGTAPGGTRRTSPIPSTPLTTTSPTFPVARWPGRTWTWPRRGRGWWGHTRCRAARPRTTSWGHLYVQPARGRHCGADGPEEPGADRRAGRGHPGGAAIPLPAGCRTVAQPSGPAEEICWGADATGAGLATADAALAATP